MSFLTKHRDALHSLAERMRLAGNLDSGALIFATMIELDRLEAENAALVATDPLSTKSVVYQLDQIERRKHAIRQSIEPVIAALDDDAEGVRLRCQHDWGFDSGGKERCKACGRARP